MFFLNMASFVQIGPIEYGNIVDSVTCFKMCFVLISAYPAPHGPEDSAPQYQDQFLNVTSHHTPAYNNAPNPDKQWILRHTQQMLPIHKKFTDVLMTKRLQTLQSGILRSLIHTYQCTMLM